MTRRTAPITMRPMLARCSVIPPAATAGMARCALQNLPQTSANQPPTIMFNTAPTRTGTSLQRALREIVSVNSLRNMRSSIRRSRLCQPAFNSSSSMQILRVPAQPLLEPADLGSQVGGRDAEDLGDLGERTVFEIEQQHGPIEWRLRVDEAAQDAAAVIRIGLVTDRRIVQLRLVGHGSLATRRLGAQPGNRDVQRDAVQPGRKAALRVVCRERAPRLCGDFLRQVFEVRASARVAARDPVDQALVLAQQGRELG